MKAAAYPLLTEKILSLFRAGLAQGWFDFINDDENDRLPDSVRLFLQVVLSHAGKSPKDGFIAIPAVGDLDSVTLARFLEHPCSNGSSDRSRIRAVVLGWLIGLAPKFITMSTMHSPVVADEIEEQRLLTAETGGKFAQLAMDDEFCRDIGESLLTTLLLSHGADTLRSFFIVQPAVSGFLSWRPDSFSHLGTPLKLVSIPVDAGVVTVRVNRYENVMRLPVQAYEWMAELRLSSASQYPDAIACGMFYKFDTDVDGISIGEPDDLIIAADEVADVDVLQVKAFLDQHKDAEGLLAGSDICFVWLWERRKGAEKGLGKSCLEAALKNLKKRFKRLGVVVFDMQPAQFLSINTNQDPAEIQVERAEAIERLSECVESMKVGDLIGGTSRIIFNHDGNDGDAALAVVRSTF